MLKGTPTTYNKDFQEVHRYFCYFLFCLTELFMVLTVRLVERRACFVVKGVPHV